MSRSTSPRKPTNSKSTRACSAFAAPAGALLDEEEDLAAARGFEDADVEDELELEEDPESPKMSPKTRTLSTRIWPKTLDLGDDDADDDLADIADDVWPRTIGQDGQTIWQRTICRRTIWPQTI